MFWQGVFLLLGLRARFALQVGARNASRLVGLALALLLGAPASFAAAGQFGGRLKAATPLEQEPLLCGALLIMQALWLILLIPGVGVVLGRNLPARILRPYPLRAGQAVMVDTLGALGDIPLLFALPLFGTVALRLGRNAGQQILIFIVLSLFAAQTIALSQLMSRLWESVGARAFRWQTAGAFAVAAGCVTVLLAGLPPAYALVTAVRPLKANPLPSYSSFTPSGMAAHTIGAVSRGEWGYGFLFSVLLVASIGAFLWMADRLQTQNERTFGQRSTTYRAVPLAPAFATRPLLPQIAAATGTEWRMLLRHPSAHMPLRAPALFLMIGFVGWTLSGGGEALANLRDLVEMCAIFYVFLWQIQLSCNRWGNEAGTIRLLLGFPVSRRALILGRNLALLGLLVPLNAAGIVAMCFVAQAPHYIGPIALWAAMTLVCLTALGNVVSILVPFPITRRIREDTPEPDRIVGFFYVTLGGVITGLLLPVQWVAEQVTWWVAGPGAVLYLAGIFYACLKASEKLLVRRERALLVALDGDE